MRLPVRILTAVALAIVCAGPIVQAQQPPDRQDVFVPVDSLPPQEQMPAAPLLVGAYSFVLIALFLYLVSLARRMQNVQREIERLDRDVNKPGRA